MIGFCRISASDPKLPATTISVYGLKSINIPQSLALSLQQHLESKLLKCHGYSGVTRNNIDLILQEGRFDQTAECSDEECIMRCRLYPLGVEKLVTGTVSQVGATYNIVLKLIDIKSAKPESSASARHQGSVNQPTVKATGFHLCSGMHCGAKG
jgi:hypothetical protein